jgi:hypothetical protein
MLKFKDNYRDENGNFTGRFRLNEWVIDIQTGESFQVTSCHGWVMAYGCYGYSISNHRGTFMNVSEIAITHDLIKLRESLEVEQ